MEIKGKTLRNIFLGVMGCIVLYWILHESERLLSVISFINNMCSPFIVGAALAFVLNVPMRAIERKLQFVKKPGARRAVAILLTFVAVVMVLAIVFQLLIPQLMETMESLVARLPGFFNNIVALVNGFLEEHPELQDWLTENTDIEKLDVPALVSKIANLVGDSLAAIWNGTVSAIGSVTGIVVNAVISLVFALYALSRKEILARQGRRLLYAFLPERVCDETVRILRMTNVTFSNFISGQCLEAVILGSMFAVAMLIFKMPYVVLVSVIIAVTALIPLVGAFLGCFLGAFFILVVDPFQAVMFVVMFLVIQQIEGNLIYPKVVGTSIGLPGMWVLVAVTVGGELMGVGGMLLMIPLTSVAYALLREITDKRLAAREIDREKLLDQPLEVKSRLTQKKETAKKRFSFPARKKGNKK